MPHFSEWTAEEDDDGYQFSIMGKPEDDQTAALFRLHRKVITGLQHKTLQLQDSKFPLSNALHTVDGQYSLNEVGSGRIECDRETECAHLIIDGRSVLASDFFRLLSTYEGYTLLFQIQDLSDDVLEKDMVLVPLRIDAETFLYRIDECLSWFLDGSFLSYKREPACSSALSERLHEFEQLCRHGKPETARAVGQTIMERLLAVEHDTDDFPDHHINFIKQSMPDFEP